MEYSINYIAVVVAAAANMFIGFMWYGPVFGKYWMGLMGFTPESIKQMKMTPIAAMIGGVITALIMACVLSRFSSAVGATDAMSAALVAFWIWLGFVATTQAGSFLWEGKPISLFILNAAQSLVSIVVMALILVLWPW